MLSKARAAKLKPVLDAVRDQRPWADRVRFDPVEFPHRYRDARDIEVVALLSASLAYGRADLFKPKVAWLLERLGDHPAQTVQELKVQQLSPLLEGFVYRFNVPADLGVLLLGIGASLRRVGSLEAVFLEQRTAGQTWHEALSGFANAIRDAAPKRAIELALGPTRGLAHLLPTGAGASKRLSLYLRWMVRGPDEIDFGVWKQVSSAELVIPLDTHIARLGTWLGLTKRKTEGWAMAEEITASLRQLEPGDPVRYDFSLCHFGMSGACPRVPRVENCRRCPLRAECQIGRRSARASRVLVEPHD